MAFGRTIIKNLATHRAMLDRTTVLSGLGGAVQSGQSDRSRGLWQSRIKLVRVLVDAAKTTTRVPIFVDIARNTYDIN